jgi:penicillin-binding protein 2
MLFDGYFIKESLKEIETNEVFLDNLAHQKEEDLGLFEKKFEVSINSKSIYAILVIFIIMLVVALLRLFHMQIIRGEYWSALAQSNKGKIIIIRPERGVIYDKNLDKLAANIPAYDLLCDKDDLVEDNDKINIIASSLKKSPSDIKESLLLSEINKVLLGENLTQESILILESFLSQLPECYIDKNTVRHYAFGPSFSHIMGYSGRISKVELELNPGNYALNDYIGKSGLEKFYEQELRGIAGKLSIEKTALGDVREGGMVSESIAGNSLILNIDGGLQKKVYESLEKNIKNVGAKKGAAVALDPRTGAVLALVSYPAYDNNVFSGGISKKDFEILNSNPNQPFFNRAISAQYPTGSTIKPFLSAGALEESLISPNKLINDPGYILVHSQYDPSVVYRFEGVKPHGLVDMRRALAVSSNIYFYTIGGGYENQQGLGPGRIKKYLDLFGWEKKTGIDLPGEFSGFVPTPSWKRDVKKEPWWDGDTYNLSIGQSDLQVTPLQVAVAYAAIANGGTIYKPQVVNKIINGSGDVDIKEFNAEIINSGFIDENNMKVVREGMRDCVEKDYGSCVMLRDLPTTVAGKTGTAETGKKEVYNTWASSFAPYEDPEIVFVATIEGVQGLRAATLPIAHEVLNWYFSKNKK